MQSCEWAAFGAWNWVSGWIEVGRNQSLPGMWAEEWPELGSLLENKMKLEWGSASARCHQRPHGQAHAATATLCLENDDCN